MNRNDEWIKEENIPLLKKSLVAYEDLFKVGADPRNFIPLLDLYGVENVLKALQYLQVTGVTPPKKGQRNNPPAFLMKVIENGIRLGFLK